MMPFAVSRGNKKSTRRSTDDTEGAPDLLPSKQQVATALLELRRPNSCQRKEIAGQKAHISSKRGD